MKKSLISLAALVACAAMSSAAFAASLAVPAVIETGQVLDPAAKAVEVKPTRIIAVNFTSAVAKAMALEMQLAGTTKVLADVSTGAHANLRELHPESFTKM